MRHWLCSAACVMLITFMNVYMSCFCRGQRVWGCPHTWEWTHSWHNRLSWRLYVCLHSVFFLLAFGCSNCNLQVFHQTSKVLNTKLHSAATELHWQDINLRVHSSLAIAIWYQHMIWSVTCRAAIHASQQLSFMHHPYQTWRYVKSSTDMHLTRHLPTWQLWSRHRMRWTP